MIFVVQSCIQAPSNTRRALLSSSSSTTPTKASPNLPDFTEGNNFVQNGGTVFSSSILLDIGFTDSFQLRGKDVDNYIRKNGTQNISCLTARFTDNTVNQINILAAIAHSVYNFTNQTLEYYYSVSPSDEVTNKNFCQKSGLINSLFALNPALTPKFKFSDLCPSGLCVSSYFTSQPLQLFSQTGTLLSQVTTTQLNYTLSNKPNISSPIGNACTTGNECKAQGYDCCSLGQCVKDLTLKPGVDPSSANYIQALQDILNNPSHVYNYPQYYFICSTTVVLPSNPTTPTSPSNDAVTRLKNLADLYNCTTKIEGELGICTKTISNPIVNSTYSAGRDDKSFSGTYTNLPSNSYTPTEKEELSSIEEVSYGEVILFKYDQILSDAIIRPDPLVVSNYLTLNGHHNDDSASGTSVTLTDLSVPGVVSKDLVIKYRTDASCVQINSLLGKCEKYYIQGQQKSGDTLAQNRRGRVTDHYPASNIFKLPIYASTDKTIRVEVDGILQKQDSDWQLNATSPASIEFFSSNNGLKVFDSQKVKITFFVDLNVNHVMDSKLEALAKIQQICHCATLDCSLAPVKNPLGQINDYSCVYPDPNPIEPPVSQKIYLSSKNVPVRYFDTTGSSKPAVTGDTLAQEGIAFLYRKDNLLNPNNMPDITNNVFGEDNYVGFNEIYGSLSYTNSSAKPAKEISVAKGKTYDIYVDGGTYSNCVQCGNDYNSQLTKLFPLTQFAGGIVPLQSRTDRNQSNGISADDLSFGRACLVPASMIPFSHAISSDPQEQRQNRLRAQHLLYANGYQHDWYGFDYGAVIGSFDGVRWFAIGTNRRIKADSNKLFIAVNGPFGDLALESTFAVTINDAALNPVGTNMVTSDIESDGAQCQKFHQCTTDNDCATTLGWDYTCSSVNDITTSWPRFDDNSKEIPDAMRDDNRFISILGLSTTGKRCVYRGRGSACTQNYEAININSTFNQAQSPALHTCSTNNYCQSLYSNSALTAKFNNRISRYGKVRSDPDSDSYGLGTKVPGRPMEYNAVETIRSETARNLNSNKIAGLCIPGRDPESTSFINQNTNQPANEFLGDKILGMGMTYKKSTVLPVSTYLASCPVFDDTKNYFYASTSSSPSSANAANNALIINSSAQAISTNALNIFNSIFSNKGLNFGLYSNNTSVIKSQTFTENRCMRAPGASCFSDLDCAPSITLANRIKMITAGDTSLVNILNSYEIKFWQEELICSQVTPKSDPTYTSANNRCCRDVGKIISLPSADASNLLEMTKIAGVELAMNDKNRYSRLATLIKDQKTDPLNFPALQVAAKNQCSLAGGCATSTILPNQFKTFSAFAERTSCSGDWVRIFLDKTHKWDKVRFQSFNPEMFRCMNWLPSNSGWSCSGLEQDDPSCSLLQTSPYSGKAKAIFSYLGRLELMGIPQIAMESGEFFNDSTEGDLSCRSYPTNQNGCYPGHPDPASCTPVNPDSTKYAYPTQLFTNTAVAEYQDANGKKLFSGVDKDNFQNMKQIFSSDEVIGCYPAGTTMAVGADASLCCTGFINAQNNKCQLQDFIDVSVYTNRYVSSEAKKLSPALFDSSGFIKDPSYVAQLACEKRMCASGKLAYGVLISKLKTPGQETIQQKYFRFLENSSIDDDNGLLTLFNNGLKLNTHAYCYPTGSSSGNSQDLTIISCGN